MTCPLCEMMYEQLSAALVKHNKEMMELHLEHGINLAVDPLAVDVALVIDHLRGVVAGDATFDWSAQESDE